MKNQYSTNKNLFNTDPAINDNSLNEKTTNINILLNRVKLDKKNDFKRKIVSLSSLVLLVCVVTFFAVV